MCWLSWFSCPGCCSCPGLHLRLRASDCAPGLAFCFDGPLDICLDLLSEIPPPPVQKRDAQHMFLQHRGAHAENRPDTQIPRKWERTGKSRKRRKKAFFIRYPQICLNPHLLNPHLRHFEKMPISGKLRSADVPPQRVGGVSGRNFRIDWGPRSGQATSACFPLPRPSVCFPPDLLSLSLSLYIYISIYLSIYLSFSFAFGLSRKVYIYVYMCMAEASPFGPNPLKKNPTHALGPKRRFIEVRVSDVGMSKMRCSEKCMVCFCSFMLKKDKQKRRKTKRRKITKKKKNCVLEVGGKMWILSNMFSNCKHCLCLEG